MAILIEVNEEENTLDYQELVTRVNSGEEFQFYYKKEEYWISMNKEGYYLTRGKDSYYQSFLSANALFEHGRIDGKSIQELWKEIEI
ncbi:hypothetical protein [Salipaludibacillus agaradhaerens]|uniref:hypothetical protein n=1 Tax=Salipaludibacillus agaradhaerens TaxID=76935 RepID=UPI00215080FD|nr:hypothetical protein [Salipaludibacillus agaradhaerens]